MIQLNLGDHVSSEPDWVAIAPITRVSALRWSREKAIWIARNIRTANPYYRSLPGGRSLTQLLADRRIWVNLDRTTGAYGLTNFVGGSEIAIGLLPFRIGRWSVLATLVHELAHVNGAPGEPSMAAERAVLACGLGRSRERNTGLDDAETPYDPTIIGSLRGSPAQLVA